MSRKKEITTDELNKALWHISREARRKNRALGLDTLYEKDGYLVKLDASGEEHRIKKLEKKKQSSPPRIVIFD
ncbi:hypothetical protein ACG2F4_17870 [Halalkalibaculum sp. DA3122]|uniref:hypothetical protein n=1 Tax=unclassified Halalkalibaculum TaxID=2964617 RepID=UPI0037551FA7